jgi:hypothetical protein
MAKNMQIKNYSTGALEIDATDGAVVLKDGGATKLTTTDTGVTVTGAMTATSFVGDGSNLTGISGGSGGSYANADVDAHLNKTTIAAGKILGWTGTDYAWVDQAGSGSSYSDADAVAAVVANDIDMGGNKVLFANVYSALGDLPNAGTYHGMFAHVHGTGKAYFAHSGQWVELANAADVGSGGGTPARNAAAGTTASIAQGIATDIDITGHKSYALMAIETSHAAWVTIYANNSVRVSDNSRTETTDPAPDSGIIAEVITTGAETVLISPGTIGYNFESTPTTNIPVKVRNKGNSAQAITVTLTILKLEE